MARKSSARLLQMHPGVCPERSGQQQHALAVSALTSLSSLSLDVDGRCRSRSAIAVATLAREAHALQQAGAPLPSRSLHEPTGTQAD